MSASVSKPHRRPPAHWPCNFMIQSPDSKAPLLLRHTQQPQWRRHRDLSPFTSFKLLSSIPSSWSSVDGGFASGAINLGGGLHVFQTASFNNNLVHPIRRTRQPRNILLRTV
ncbi:unnamed protein product [Linum trigynum]|uniref:Uncharacterized protein n=1 Tax=Linum trigynum TaxID=586398 RepID=A0AAV2G6A3_9ROSI